MDFFSRKQARRYLLAKQGLWPPRSARGREGLVRLLDGLRCVQYDPIDIVGRNHEIMLQARLASFRRGLLDEALYNERTLVEGWDKQMSFGPAADRPYFEHDRTAAADHHRFREDGPLSGMFALVRDEIRRRGPLSSLEIESDVKLDWSWAPARAVRAALEALWFRGELTIHHRDGSRRYYDFTENIFPGGPPDPAGSGFLGAASSPPPEEVLADPILRLDWRIARRIAAVGFLMAKSGDGWLGIPAKTGERRASVARLVERGVAVSCEVEGLPETAFRLADDGGARERASESPVPRAAVLAPLDNLMWDRSMVRSLFDFDYVWEVYKPAALRRWGYYVLPVLYGDRLVARFEPGRDRPGGMLIVKNWWTEPGVRTSGAAARAVAVALRALATANGLDAISLAADCAREPLLAAVGPN